jgi:hypothetical protein
VLPLVFTGCAFLPALANVVSRIDIPRAIACATAPREERARCVGAAALTPALDQAITEAAAAGRRALEAAGPAGAELSPAEQRAAARDAERALDKLADEVVAINGELVL